MSGGNIHSLRDIIVSSKLKISLFGTILLLGIIFIPTQAEALDFSKNIGTAGVDFLVPWDVAVDSKNRLYYELS